MLPGSPLKPWPASIDSGLRSACSKYVTSTPGATPVQFVVPAGSRAAFQLVVVDTRAGRVAARYLRDHARERSERHRRLGVGELRAAPNQSRQRRLRMGSHVPGQVGLMKSVHRDEKDMLGLRFLGAGSLRRNEHPGHEAGRSQHAEDTKARSGHKLLHSDGDRDSRSRPACDVSHRRRGSLWDHRCVFKAALSDRNAPDPSNELNQ